MGAVLREPLAERMVGRYAIYGEIASGGMAVVHIGRLLGQAGFARTVAIKRLHPQYAKDPDFVRMFLDEARLAVRVQHPNVVAPLDVVIVDDELFLVMEYVSGEALSRLLRPPSAETRLTKPPIVASIMIGALYGLHAAHEAVSEKGMPLSIVHRDVSPQNIMVGLDGIARVLDFGVAKAAQRSQSTSGGELKGKIAYMAPEQVKGGRIDRRTDVFAAGVVYWEALTGQRLFHVEEVGATLIKVLSAEIRAPSYHNREVSRQVDAVVMRALQRDPALRFQTAREFAVAVERAIAPATPSEVGDWVRDIGGPSLVERVERVAAIENHSSSMPRAIREGALPPPPPRSPITTPVRLPPPPSPSASAPVRVAPLPVPPLPVPVRPRQSSVPSPSATPSPSPSEPYFAPAIPQACLADTLLVASPQSSDPRRPVEYLADAPSHAPPIALARSAPAQSPQPRTKSVPRRLIALGAVLLFAGSIIAGVLSALGGRPSTHRAAGSQARESEAKWSTGSTASVGATGAPAAAPSPAASNEAADCSTDAATYAAVATASAGAETVDSTAVAHEERAAPAKRVGGSTSTTTHTVAPSTKPPTGSSRPNLASCNPPYYLDARGIRRLRPECM